MAKRKTHYGVSVLDLLNAGMLSPGDGLEYEPRTGEVYAGQIERDGSLSIGGEHFRTPSGAATSLARRSGLHPKDSRDGWKEIKAKGRPIEKYRDEFLRTNPTRQPPAARPVYRSSFSSATAQPPIVQPTEPTGVSASLVELVAAHLNELRMTLRRKILDLSADGFEELVADVLKRVGYSQVRRVGGPGDRNIDVIGLYARPFIETSVRVQVKHRTTATNVGPTDVAAFRDRAGGVDLTLLMVTNVEFTDGAKETAAEHSRQRIHLVEGEDLIEAMIERRIGVVEGALGVIALDETFWHDFR